MTDSEPTDTSRVFDVFQGPAFEDRGRWIAPTASHAVAALRQQTRDHAWSEPIPEDHCVLEPGTQEDYVCVETQQNVEVTTPTELSERPGEPPYHDRIHNVFVHQPNQLRDARTWVERRYQRGDCLKEIDVRQDHLFVSLKMTVFFFLSFDIKQLTFRAIPQRKGRKSLTSWHLIIERDNSHSTSMGCFSNIGQLIREVEQENPIDTKHFQSFQSPNWASERVQTGDRR